MLDILLFTVLPYMAFIVAMVMALYRYRTNSFKFSSLSSEFLENNHLFWGSVPWHYGILVVLSGHLIGFLFPRHVLAFGSIPVRLLIMEVTALIFGLMALFGVCMLIYRRFTHSRIKIVTTGMDIFILVLLVGQVLSGVLIALFYRWGINWYTVSLVPYLKSVLVLSPNLNYVSPLPHLIKYHIVSAILILVFIPFSRFMHFLVVPVHYLWRNWQRVIWNYDRKMIRKRY
ncbi:MAG: respiratory nitrate reductase subunit gamma [Bdellovibrio sp.]|nr:respiratory nitrate reductase subunit gamma [Bdellovibrio sp.]